MKTFDICSGCFEQHNWREIDYYNVLYVSMQNAISLTLCPKCLEKFKGINSKKDFIQYKQRIDTILVKKFKLINSEPKPQNYAVSNWGLFFSLI